MTREEQKIALLVHRIKDNCYEVAENLLKEHDKQIKVDAIDECIALVNQYDDRGYDLDTVHKFTDNIAKRLEQLKQQMKNVMLNSEQEQAEKEYEEWRDKVLKEINAER